MMLHSRNRLRRSADVERVRQHGKRRRHPFLILLVYPNELSHSRFAFIASRRVGKAVQRNRAKRVLREVIRHQLIHIAPGWDCVLIARPPLLQAPFSDVETAVWQLLKRAKLLTVSKPTEA